MISRLKKVSLVLGLVAVALPAAAECNDKEFGTYQIYRVYADANSRTPDGQLINIFAAGLEMDKVEFRDLYLRCAARAKTMGPEEVQAFRQKEQEAFVASCAKQATRSGLCKTVLGR